MKHHLLRATIANGIAFADNLVGHKDYAGAIDVLERTQRYAPFYNVQARIECVKGISALANGNSKEALRYLGEAIELDNTVKISHAYFLARAYQKQEQYAEAVKYYDVALIGYLPGRETRLGIEAGKDWAAAVKSRLICMYFAKAYDRAIAEALEMKIAIPADKDVNGVLGASLAALGRYEEAYAPLALAVTKNHRYDGFLRKLEHVCSMLGRHEEAAEYRERLLEKYPDDALLHRKKGVEFARRGHFVEAINACDRALTLNPDFALARLSLALCHQKISDPALTSEKFREAVDCAHDGGQLKAMTQGAAALHNGDRAMALQWYQVACVTAPAKGEMSIYSREVLRHVAENIGPLLTYEKPALKAA